MGLDKMKILNALNLHDLVPLIPAFSILLVLILIYSIYKLQAHLKKGKRLDQIQHDLDEDDKKIQETAKVNPLVVPSANKTRSISLKSEIGIKPDLLDNDLRDKPLFPVENISPPLTPSDKSCDDLYKELLDSESFEEGLYKDLSGDSEAKPVPATTSPTSSEDLNDDLASETLLLEIEKEFLSLERDLHGDTSTTAKSISAPTNDLSFDLSSDFALSEANTPAPVASGLNQCVPVTDLQQEMEDAIKKLSQHLGKQEYIAEPQVAEPPSNDLKNEPVPQPMPASQKPASPTPASQRTGHYIDKLKAFQNNLERRFGSLEIANAENEEDRFNDATESRAARPFIRMEHDEKQSAWAKKSLDLLESFLFTANQRKAKQ